MQRGPSEVDDGSVLLCGVVSDAGLCRVAMELTLISCAFDGGGGVDGEGAASGAANIRAAASRPKTPRRLGTGRCTAVWFASDPAQYVWALVDYCTGRCKASHASTSRLCARRRRHRC